MNSSINNANREARKSRRFGWLLDESFFQAVLLIGVVSVIVERAAALNVIA